MRPYPLAFRAAGAAACICALTAVPAAYADATDGADGTDGTVRISPSSAMAGSEVGLRVHGCEGTTGQAVSDAFVSRVSLAPSADEDGLFAEATVKSAATPGTYRVSAVCGGAEETARGTVTVVADPGSSPSPDLSPSHSSQSSPTAPVPAGGGGTVTPATDSGGPGTRHALTGLALAAVAAVAVAGRSVRRRRGQD